MNKWEALLFKERAELEAMPTEEIESILAGRGDHEPVPYEDGEPVTFVQYRPTTGELVRELVRRQMKGWTDESLWQRLHAVGTYWRLAADELEVRCGG